jgi:hypothetical protein
MVGMMQAAEAKRKLRKRNAEWRAQKRITDPAFKAAEKQSRDVYNAFNRDARQFALRNSRAFDAFRRELHGMPSLSRRDPDWCQPPVVDHGRIATSPPIYVAPGAVNNLDVFGVPRW